MFRPAEYEGDLDGTPSLSVIFGAVRHALGFDGLSFLPRREVGASVGRYVANTILDVLGGRGGGRGMCGRR